MDLAFSFGVATVSLSNFASVKSKFRSRNSVSKCGPEDEAVLRLLVTGKYFLPCDGGSLSLDLFPDAIFALLDGLDVWSWSDSGGRES